MTLFPILYFLVAAFLLFWVCVGGSLKPIFIAIAAFFIQIKQPSELEVFAREFCDCLRPMMAIGIEIEFQKPDSARLVELEQEARQLESAPCFAAITQKMDSFETAWRDAPDRPKFDSVVMQICPEIMNSFQMPAQD